MRKVLKDRWIAALRSGKHKQGFFTLKDQYGCYCGLGLLMHVLSKGDKLKHHVTETDARILIHFGGHPNDFVQNTVPEDVATAIGLSHEARVALMQLNDAERIPFPKLADWIEENV